MKVLDASLQAQMYLKNYDEARERMGGLIAELIMDYAKRGEVSDTFLTDIPNLLNGFCDSDRVIILTKALVLVGMNGKFGVSNNNGSSRPSSNSSSSSSKNSSNRRFNW